jgi:hypothetical protein
VRTLLAILFLALPAWSLPDQPVRARFQTNPEVTEVYQQVSSPTQPGRFLGTSDRPIWLDGRAGQLQLVFRAQGFRDLSLRISPAYFSQHRCWPEHGQVELQADWPGGWWSRLGRWLWPIALGTLGVAFWRYRSRPCQTLGGYRLLECIGEGGSAKIYRAVAPGCSDGPVALKVFSQNPGRPVQLEAHPGLAQTYFWACQNGVHYQAMELYTGGTLRQRLQSGPVGRAQIRRWLSGVCEALCFAHDRGVIHTDLKPENILFSATGELKVADFASAENPSATPAYRAPEQLLGQALGPWTDQYAVALLAHEMLTGRRPQGLERSLSALPPLEPHCSTPLDQVLARMSAPNPEHRFPDLKSAYQALLEALCEA